MVRRNNRLSRGQVGLTVLLITVVLVTVGVAVAGRCVTTQDYADRRIHPVFKFGRIGN